jgi:LuxR family maltose regulon positive regulatory protein
MASISLQGRKDVDGFIKSFTGSHRYVLDYLIEEVLEQQPESVQTFMFQTAILDRLTGSLCNAVTGQENGQETLEMLESANLFIIPLDNQRRWYRYHHLFADLLKQRLKSNPEVNIQDLHIRTRDWFSKQGMDREALQHSLLAEDFQKAAELINRLAMEVVQKGEYRTLSDWINSLPNEIQREHPFLWALDVWALRMEGQFEAAETRISDVEEAIKNPAHKASVDLGTIKGLINSHKAYIAFIRGKFDETISISRESLTQLPQDMVEIRTLTALYLGVALRYKGSLQEALEIYLSTLPYGKQLIGSSIAVFCFIHLSDLYYDLGELQKSKGTAEQAIQFTNQHTGRPDWPFMGHLYICIGRVLRQWGRLTEALEVTLKGVGLCRQWNVADFQALACIELADVYFSLGEKELAQDALKESLQTYQEFSPWASGLVAAHQAKHSLGFDEIEAAIEWLGGTDLTADSPIDLSRDIELLTLARVFIAQNKMDEGLALLERISEVSDEIGKKYTALEAMILQAKAFFIHDDTEKAMERLEQALTFGEAEGYVQIFVDEGPPMARLLYDALVRGIAPDYVQRLLAAFPVEKPEQVHQAQSQSPETEWIEPLTDRELDILHLLAAGFTNPVIGSKLYLATNTVKAHLRNIYGKLGVNNRTQAVVRARGLGIISDR